MPANSRVFLKPFIGGLNTEGSDTDDMVLNTSDELNCTILPEQMRGRRYGFNIEKDGKWIESGESTIVAHSLHHWNNVYDNVNYLVVQINKHLYIYPDERPFSQQSYIADIDLSEYETLNVVEPLSMTSVTSSLFVVGRWIKPIVVEAIPNTQQFTIVINNPKFRDFNGVEDGYAVDYLPTQLTNRHKYNLINQGWDKTIYDPTSNPKERTLLPDGSYNGLFYEEYASTYGSGCYPANNMQWFLGKQNSGKYNTTDVLNTYFGNTPAPKGHFIIDYLNRDRSAVSGIDLDDEPAELNKNYTETLPINNSGYLAAAEIADRVYFGGSPYPEAYITIPMNYKISYFIPVGVSGVLKSFSWGLKDICDIISPDIWTSPSYHHILKNTYRNNDNIKDLYIFSQPFTMSLIGYTSQGTEVVVDSREIQLTGKIFSAAGWDITATNTTSYTRYEIRLTWPNLDRSHKWIVPDKLTETISITEINYDEQTEESYEGLPSSDLLRGAISDVESFGGRVFYLCGNTVLFSQTLSTNNKNFDKCYQEADPTSEEVSDVVATDGGMIQLLSLGRGKALKSFYRGVLVFGDEEVTGVLSNSINLFSADSYDVVKITTAGLTSKHSVVETDNAVFYWSNHGIYMVSIDENNNISANCISLATIQNWYNNLSQTAKDNCVGYYDYANNRIYWFYPISSNTDKLDGCLVYDLTFNCFMPQYIDSGSVIRDLHGNYAGLLNAIKNSYTINGKTFPCTVEDNNVYDDKHELIGYTQNTYLTDCQESSSVYEIEPTMYLRAGGNKVVAGDYNVLATPVKDAVFNRKTAGIFLISDGTNYSFGDFNDREFRDWDLSPYNSYLVSRPITLGDTYFNKQTPVMQTLFKRTEEYRLKKSNNTYTNSIYMLSAVKNIGGHSETILPDTGKFVSANVKIDLTAYTGVTLDTVSATIIGYKEDDTTDTLDAITLTDVEGGGVESLVLTGNNDTMYKQFKIVTAVETYTNEIPVDLVITLDREGYNGPMFTGYKEVVCEGYVPLPTVNSVTIENVKGILKEGTFTLSPWYVHFFTPVIEDTWEADLTASNIAGHVTNESPTITGTFTNTDFVTSIQVSVMNYDHTGGNGVLRSAGINYNYTVLVPTYGSNYTGTYADYTTPSGVYIRMRWGWSVNPLSNRWDMVQNGYRPQKDFLHDDYVESRLHIKGRGKAFQIEIRNDENKDFRLTGLNIITRSPQ